MKGQRRIVGPVARCSSQHSQKMNFTSNVEPSCMLRRVVARVEGFATKPMSVETKCMLVWVRRKAVSSDFSTSRRTFVEHSL